VQFFLSHMVQSKCSTCLESESFSEGGLQIRLLLHNSTPLLNGMTIGEMLWRKRPMAEMTGNRFEIKQLHVGNCSGKTNDSLLNVDACIARLVCY